MEIEKLFSKIALFCFFTPKMQFDDRLTFFVNNSEYFSDISMYNCVLECTSISIRKLKNYSKNCTILCFSPTNAFP